MSREMEGAQKVPESDVVPETTESVVENEAVSDTGGAEQAAPIEPAPEAPKLSNASTGVHAPTVLGIAVVDFVCCTH